MRDVHTVWGRNIIASLRSRRMTVIDVGMTGSVYLATAMSKLQSMDPEIVASEARSLKTQVTDYVLEYRDDVCEMAGELWCEDHRPHGTGGAPCPECTWLRWQV